MKSLFNEGLKMTRTTMLSPYYALAAVAVLLLPGYGLKAQPKAGHDHHAMMHMATPKGKPAAPAVLPKEADYYQLLRVFQPDGVVLEVGGVCTMPGGQIAACTRRGEVWIIANPEGEGGNAPVFQLFATGMHEALGIAYHNNALYVTQRGELTKLIDSDGDGTADVYETVCRIPLSGNYHEYGYGPVFDKEGNAYITLNVGFFNPKWYLGVARVPFRGWALKVKPDGTVEPYAAGLRSPAAIYVSKAGDVLYGENQGDFIGSGWVMELKKGDFAGHPASLDWAHLPGSEVKARPGYANAMNGRTMLDVKDTIPGLKLPAVWFPQGIMGVSTCGIVELANDSALGPFGGQFLIGDQGQSKVMRMTLQRVKGVLQGACYDFRKDFASGVLRMAQGPDGQVYVGQTNRGWSSEGKEDFALQRIRWRGALPFEMKEIKALADGFDIELTQPCHAASAKDFDTYKITSFTYKYHPTYGSPVIRERVHTVQLVQVSEDGMHVRLVVDSLRKGYIYEVRAEGLATSGGLPLLHPAAYYTLNEIPDGEKLAYTPRPKAKAMPAKMVKEAKSTSGTGAATAPKVAKAALPKHLNKMPADWGKPDMVINISTKPGLKFEPAQLEVKAGARIKLTFTNPDDMLHNFVLVQPGSAIPVGEAAMKLGLEGMKLNYIPKSDKVVAHTFVLQPQSNETIYFTAPAKAGTYTYVCTLPGHFYTMQGTLKVR